VVGEENGGKGAGPVEAERSSEETECVEDSEGFFLAALELEEPLSSFP